MNPLPPGKRIALGQRRYGLSRSTRGDRTRRAAGLIEDNEAAGAQVEVSRRLIAAADAQTALPSSVPSARWRRRVVAIVALVLLPFGAAGLYLALGSLALPDQPLAPRLAAVRGNRSVDTLIAQIQGMVERLSERLHRDGGADVEGWLRLVRSYMVLGEPDKARAAIVECEASARWRCGQAARLDDLIRGLGLEG
jgi:cytochrome c-type biogenesis protein CcmH/NrfG